jgi:hypothetical protein
MGMVYTKFSTPPYLYIDIYCSTAVLRVQLYQSVKVSTSTSIYRGKLPPCSKKRIKKYTGIVLDLVLLLLVVLLLVFSYSISSIWIRPYPAAGQTKITVLSTAVLNLVLII